MKKLTIVLITVVFCILLVTFSFGRMNRNTDDSHINVQIESIELVESKEIREYYSSEYLIKKWFLLYQANPRYKPVRISFSAVSDIDSDDVYKSAVLISSDRIVYDSLPYNVSEAPIIFEKDVPCRFSIYAYVKNTTDDDILTEHLRNCLNIHFE